MEHNQDQEQPMDQLPISELALQFKLLQQFLQTPFRLFDEVSETLVHGRPLTPEERMIKRKQKLEELKRREIKLYGRILTPEERRKEAIERAEQRNLDLKLRAIQAEQRESEERARAAERRRAALRDEANSLIDISALSRPLSRPEIQIPRESEKVSLQPGELRTLKALKAVSPNGLTVKELAPLTKKDDLAEETPRGSLDAWLSNLKAHGLVRANSERPKKWFFVKDYES